MPRRRHPVPPAPLPQRRGVDPVHLRLPPHSPHPTARDHLVAHLSGAPDGEIDTMLAAGEIVTADGRPLPPDAPYAPGTHLWFHRRLPDETPVPHPIGIVHRDDAVLVADKPHFVATTPGGRHVAETALARLRRDTGLPALSPAHRLDRLTAGLVLFVVDPALRGAYQALFAERRVHKEYLATARHDPALPLPATRRSRIEKERGVHAAREVPGPPNAESRIELLDHRAGLARYRLTPRTGKTHQLRLHMAALGLPLRHDPLYGPDAPGLTDLPDDPERPLQLLAHTLAFTDPRTGTPRRFTSRLALQPLP